MKKEMKPGNPVQYKIERKRVRVIKMVPEDKVVDNRDFLKKKVWTLMDQNKVNDITNAEPILDEVEPENVNILHRQIVTTQEPVTTTLKAWRYGNQ